MSSTSRRPAYAAALQPQLEKIAKDLLVTGAVVMVQTPSDGTWTMTMGTRTYRGTDPVQITDYVRIGSVTKTMTGTVVLQLADEGKLALTDPISKYVDGIPNGKNITVAQLLGMRSGLANYTTTRALNKALDEDPTRVWTPKQLLALAFASPPTAAPGKAFEYSNTNTVILGLLIEKLTGMPVSKAFQQRIFDRLGMAKSSMPAITDNQLPAPHPQGYTYGTNIETLEGNELPAALQAAAKAGTRAPLDVTEVNPSWGWTAGAGISTAGDLATYVKALVGGGLLSAKLQQQRLASVVPAYPGNPASASYGWALAKFGPLYGHTGELPGYNTFAGYDPVRHITVVVWASLAPAPDGQAPAVTMAKQIITDLY